MKLQIRHRGLIIVAVPLLLEFVLLVSLAALLQQAEAEIKQEAAAKEIVTHANILLRQLVAAASYQLAYYLNKDSLFVRKYQKRKAEVTNQFLVLKDLLHNDPDQLRLLEKTDRDIERMFNLSKKMEQSAGEPMNVISMLRGKEFFTDMWMSLDVISDDIDPLLVDAEQTVQASPAAQARNRQNIQAVIGGGLVLTVFLAFYLTSVFSKSITGRLRVLTDNTNRLAKRLPLVPPMEGSDEIAQLDTFFHKMADDLAEAIRKERAILDNAVDVICSINVFGFFTAVNPASAQVWGYSPDKLLGMNITDIIAPDDVEKFRQALDETRSAKTTETLENRVISAHQGELYMSWSLRWSEPEQSLFCVAHDISDRKEVERMKQEFVAVISHELRTPLTSLQGTLTLLLSGTYGELSASGEKRVKGAEVGITRLIGLINDLLDIEKMEAGKLIMTFADVDLADVIERSLDSVQGFAEQQDVRLKAEKKKSVTVHADSDRVVQVLVNLLSNAIKFSNDGDEVEVALSDGNGQIEVRVIDHGLGIPQGAEQSIFEKYEQAHTPDGKRRKGTGLGLAICKAIVEQHGGQIGFRRTDGGGSTFWFQLPVGTKT
jgi:PAS domain S-box-containing protein